MSVDICGIVKWVPECVAADVWLLSVFGVTMSLSVPNLIVRSALRQYLREERLMEDAEFGLMRAAALDAIHAGELDGHEWRSRLLDNGNNLVNNNGCERTFIEVWKMDAASETRLLDEMAAASETPKAKRQCIDKKMVAAPEKSEVSEQSQAADAFEESAQEGRAAPEKSEASEASEKSVETGYVINNHLAVNPFFTNAQ